MGFPEGSNLLQFAAELNIDIKHNLNLNMHSSLTRQGSIGNNFIINYSDRPSDESEWLEGEITKRLSICPVITWQPLAHHNLKIGLYSTQIDDEDMENEIFISYQAIY